MPTTTNKTPQQQPTNAPQTADRQSGDRATAQFSDNRPEAVVQLQVQDMADQSPPVEQTVQLQAAIDGSPYMAAQAERGERLFGAGAPAENKTGLPDHLKTNIEQMSGFSMDDVRVHYNSGKPAQLQAHAYAQGTDIHVAPGQERHLPHEAWHVVQQMQGRVEPTLQMKGNVPVNDDTGLEQEADVMGAKALRTKAYDSGSSGRKGLMAHELPHIAQPNGAVMQRYVVVGVNQSADRAAYAVADGTDGSKLFKSQSIEKENWERKHRNAAGQVEKKKTYKASFKEKYANQPPLKVGHQGNIAIEDTKKEPKVFFAADAVVAASNQRLEDINSPVRLSRTAGSINVPVEPTNPDSATVTIGAVIPVSSEGAQVNMGGAHECNIFAIGVIRELNKIVLQAHGSEARHTAKFKLNDEPHRGEPNQHMVAKGAIDDNLTAEQLAARMNANAAAKQPWREVLLTLPQDVQAAHTKGKISKGWVEDFGMGSDAAQTEIIAELRRRRFNFPRSDMNHILMRHRTLPTAREFGRMQRYTPDQDSALGNQRAKTLGINEYAVPKVGEAYVTARVNAQALTFAGQGDIDFRAGDAQSDLFLDQRLQQAGNQANALLQVSLRGLDVAMRGWTWHAAAVIARAGADSITFENYNRNTGGKWELEALYQTMYKELSQFLKWHPIAKNRLNKLPNVEQQVTRLAQHATEWSKRIQSYETNFSDVFENRGGRWYFQMYGPAQGPNDAEGRPEDQSFHGAWKQYNVNATTLRIGASASDAAKTRLKGQIDALETRLAAVRYIDNEALANAVTAAKLEIDEATTAVEVSEHFRAWERRINAIEPGVE